MAGKGEATELEAQREERELITDEDIDPDDQVLTEKELEAAFRKIESFACR